MTDSEYQKKYFRRRHAEDPEFHRRHNERWHVGTLRHVLDHAEGFEACFQQWSMTVQLERFYEIMRRCGRMSEQSETGGYQA